MTGCSPAPSPEPPTRDHADPPLRDRITPHWFAENSRFWYRNELRGGAKEFVGVRRLHPANRGRIDADSLPLAQPLA